MTGPVRTKELRYRGGVLRAPEFFGGRYRTEKVLAAGGFGIALVARDERIFNRRVLVKIARYDAALFLHRGDKALARRVAGQRDRLKFERAMLLAAAERGVAGVPVLIDYLTFDSPQLRGPHEAADGTSFETEPDLWRGEPCLVMSFIGGRPLSEVASDGHFATNALGACKHLIRQVGAVLDVMHQMGEHHGHRLSFVYQDLKPENVMLTRENQYVLIDFGSFAMRGIDAAGEVVVYDRNLLVSTPPYQAPELDSGLPNEEKITPSADIFSLGATVLHLLRGSAPIDPSTGEADLSLDSLDVPGPWKQWLGLATAADPAHRFAGMADAVTQARSLPGRSR